VPTLGAWHDKFLKTEQTPDEGKLHPRAGDKLLDKEWAAFDSKREDGFVDLEVPCGVVDKAAAWAFTAVNAKQARRAWRWSGGASTSVSPMSRGTPIAAQQCNRQLRIAADSADQTRIRERKDEVGEARGRRGMPAFGMRVGGP
jgi:hypothetical protein